MLHWQVSISLKHHKLYHIKTTCLPKKYTCKENKIVYSYLSSMLLNGLRELGVGEKKIELFLFIKKIMQVSVSIPKN